MKSAMVIGLGMMGSALAKALLGAGYDVTVWSRTAAKAEPLLAAGARFADSVATGIASNANIVICVRDYDSARALLDDCGDLQGKTLVHLTTATAADAIAMENWAVQKGALYLDGAILAFPSGIGKPDTTLLVAGSESAWNAGKEIIDCFGGASQYLGANVGAPTVLDAALMLPSLVCTMGLVPGAHIVESIGYDLSTYVEMLSGSLVPLIERDIRRQGHAIASNDFGDTEASLSTWAAGADHMIRGLQEQRINVELIKPILRLPARL